MYRCKKYTVCLGFAVAGARASIGVAITQLELRCRMKKNKFLGSSFDSFLEEEGLLEHTEAVAIKWVIARELEKKMKKSHLNKKQIAEKMGTSRSALDRLLEPRNTSVTLMTLLKATRFIGKRLQFALV